jgi:eukaryotic-like serine/threonine-protein kinase
MNINRPTSTSACYRARLRPRLLPRFTLIGVVALAGIGLACARQKHETEHQDADAGSITTVTSSSGAPAPPLPPPPPASPCPEEMVLIPAGEFWMGSDASGDNVLHRVKLSAYCLDRTEVTVAAYRRCTVEEHGGVKCAAARMTSSDGTEAEKKLRSQLCNGDRSDRDEHPINCVDWGQADSYCTWAGGKLPTEAQWEYAARGNTGRTYPWGEDRPGPKLLNSCGTECRALGRRLGQKWWMVLYEEDDGAEATSPVGSYPAGASPFGVQDMEGNVSEWVADWYDDYKRSPSPLVDPRGPEKSGAEKTRVVRGNDWQGGLPADVSAARTLYHVVRRYRVLPSVSASVIGFRCARAPR